MLGLHPMVAFSAVFADYLTFVFAHTRLEVRLLF